MSERHPRWSRAFPCWRAGVLVAALWAPFAHASVAIYVGKNLTKSGNVLLAGFGDEPSSHWLSVVPSRQHPDGATIPVGGTPQANLPGELIEIPQARETFRYISMDYSYFLGLQAPLTNGGMNEYGLAVRDVALFSRKELVEMTPKPQHGVNYSDIARIVLERARTAREAVDIAVSLIERYGYFTYGGNSHVFADPNEGWVLLEFAGGKGLWVAHRLGPNDIWMNWRGYHKMGYVQTLPTDLGKNPDYLASKNFVSFAVEQGWYKPEEGKPFNVIDVYARPDQYTRGYRDGGPQGRVEYQVRGPQGGCAALDATIARGWERLIGLRSGGGPPAEREPRYAAALGSAGSFGHRRVRSMAARRRLRSSGVQQTPVSDIRRGGQAKHRCRPAGGRVHCLRQSRGEALALFGG